MKISNVRLKYALLSKFAECKKGSSVIAMKYAGVDAALTISADMDAIQGEWENIVIIIINASHITVRIIFVCHEMERDALLMSNVSQSTAYFRYVSKYLMSRALPN